MIILCVNLIAWKNIFTKGCLVELAEKNVQKSVLVKNVSPRDKDSRLNAIKCKIIFNLMKRKPRLMFTVYLFFKQKSFFLPPFWGTLEANEQGKTKRPITVFYIFCLAILGWFLAIKTRWKFYNYLLKFLNYLKMSNLIFCFASLLTKSWSFDLDAENI